MPYDTAAYDSHGGWTFGATPTYTVPVAGDFLIVASATFTANAQDVSTLNVTNSGAGGGSGSPLVYAPSALSLRAVAVDVLALAVGDQLRTQFWPQAAGRTGLTGSANTFFVVKQLS